MNLKMVTGTTVLLAVPLLASCSMFGTKVDFGKLETQITDKLNSEYAKLDVKVDSVSCDQSNDKPEPGAKFTCDAKVKNVVVPVEVTVKDKDMNVEFVTTSKLYNLDKAGSLLAPSVSSQVKTQVKVDCGTGLKVAAPNSTFPCTVTDERGATAELTFKVGSITGDDSWQIG